MSLFSCSIVRPESQKPAAHSHAVRNERIVTDPLTFMPCAFALSRAIAYSHIASNVKSLISGVRIILSLADFTTSFTDLISSSFSSSVT